MTRGFSTGTMLPYGRQTIDDADIAAVVDVLRSDFLTQGPAVPRFEQAVAQYCGARHGIAVNSATSALHVACLALGVGPGDVVWTTPNTFVASANCARYCGADVDFVDIDARTYNVCPHALAKKLDHAKDTGRLPKAVIAVHFAGQSCDMEAIAAVLRPFNIPVIEDASHAIGGSYRGQPIGAGRYSAMTVFSFHPVKVITTGEGGMIVTNDDALARQVGMLRTHGITRDVKDYTRTTEGAWYYEQQTLGFNYRITDIQAALGWSQLRRLDEFVARRRTLAQRYDTLLKDVPGVSVPWQQAEGQSAWHLYVVQVDAAKRRGLFDQLRAAGIGVNVHYVPVYWQPYYHALGFRVGQCPIAEQYYHRALSLPMFPAMTDSDQDRVVDALRSMLTPQRGA